jgi:predicted N-formylglutamate amidohydrolase
MTDAGLLSPADPAPVRVANPDGAAPLLIVCDHASNTVPQALGSLGLTGEALSDHIGWDPGAAVIAERLAHRFDAPAVLSGFSRLVVDCNRYPHDPASMPEVSDGRVVPGNRGLTPADRQARLAAVFTPYHAAIAARLDGFAARGVCPLVLSVHSMTDSLGGVHRPWPVALSWRHDARLAPALIAALRADGIDAGDNQPYGLDPGEDYTVPEHAMRRGLAHLQVEFRQDLVSHAAGARDWADRFARALAPLLDAPELYRPEHHWP